MTKDKQRPKVILGAFIFNEKEELLLVQKKDSEEGYTCPRVELEYNEKLEDALKRGMRKDTKLKIKEIEHLSIGESIGLSSKNKEHCLYINFKARTEGKDKLKISNDLSKYKWLSVEEWLKLTGLETSTKNTLGELLQDSFENKYKRALADYQNLLRQSSKEKSEFVKYANEQLLHTLIPVYDNLKIALKHTDENKQMSPWEEGVRYVFKQFTDVLKEVGLEEVETVDRDFDPESMEAVEGKGDKVIEELRPGYKLNNKVIIPAKVKLED